jgi:hypothetical protein
MITLDMSDWRSRNNTPFNLDDVIKQKNYYLDENDRYVQVDTEVAAIYKLLSIYVPRRKSSVVQRQNVGTNSIASNFINFTQLPLTISGLSEINDYPVIAPASLRIPSSNQVIRKRSVLIVETIPYTSPNNQESVVELVTSTSALIYKKDHSEIYYYNPAGVVSTIRDSANNVGRPNPVMQINAYSANGVAGEELNAQYMETHQGALFFYESSD